MSAPFSRSLTTLQSRPYRPLYALVAVATLLLAGWATWLFVGDVSIYAVSESARVELESASYPIQTSTDGQITAVHVREGAVTKGQVILELDSTQYSLQAKEEQSLSEAAARKQSSIDRQVLGERQMLADYRESVRFSVLQAEADRRAADAAAAVARDEWSRLSRLHEKGLVSDADLARARAAVDERTAYAEASAAAIDRLQSEQRHRISEYETRLEALAREHAGLKGDVERSTAAIARLADAADRLRIRAPIAGELVEVADLRVGQVVHEGDTIATVVAPGDLRVVAGFDAPAAVGRIRRGQPARMRLSGFPWTQYGTISATVFRVAGEIRNQVVRVDLAIDASSAAIPIRHGLPGVVEIEVERVAPGQLLLRNTGMWLQPLSPNRASRVPVQ